MYLHISSPILIYPHISSYCISAHIFILYIFRYLHISSDIFTYLQISSHIFRYLQISSHLLIFTHLHTSSHILTHLHTSSHIFTHPHISPHIFAYLRRSSHIFTSPTLDACRSWFCSRPKLAIAQNGQPWCASEQPRPYLKTHRPPGEQSHISWIGDLYAVVYGSYGHSDSFVFSFRPLAQEDNQHSALTRQDSLFWNRSFRCVFWRKKKVCSSPALAGQPARGLWWSSTWKRRPEVVFCAPRISEGLSAIELFGSRQRVTSLR